MFVQNPKIYDKITDKNFKWQRAIYARNNEVKLYFMCATCCLTKVKIFAELFRNIPIQIKFIQDR